jgi:hypothetical protein
MSKYQYLEEHLRELGIPEWRASFRDIEKVIRAVLPASARAYPAWWSNNPSNNVMTKSWLSAGFQTERLDIPGEKVTFRRVRRTGAQSRFAETAPKWEARPVSEKPKSDFIVLQGVSAEVRRALQRRAEANRQTLEEEIVDLIHREVSNSSRAAKIKTIRATMASDLNVDTTQIIREGREER